MRIIEKKVYKRQQNLEIRGKKGKKREKESKNRNMKNKKKRLTSRNLDSCLTHLSSARIRCLPLVSVAEPDSCCSSADDIVSDLLLLSPALPGFKDPKIQCGLLILKRQRIIPVTF
ncbi:hypothetical protein V6Z11_A11G137800 [Gossypium hirsutum]